VWCNITSGPPWGFCSSGEGSRTIHHASGHDVDLKAHGGSELTHRFGIVTVNPHEVVAVLCLLTDKGFAVAALRGFHESGHRAAEVIFVPPGGTDQHSLHAVRLQRK
jgi:hypothetical protein